MTEVEAAQWVYLLRESVFMLANACWQDRGLPDGANAGNPRLTDHWQAFAPALSNDRPLTAAASRAVGASAAEISLLDRGIEMLVGSVRGRAAEIQSTGI